MDVTHNQAIMNIIHNQATINIGTIGHVAHGKSTLVKRISGVDTVRFHQEKDRGITIKLGYANAKIYKCPSCPSPSCYTSGGSGTESIKCAHCQRETILIRHISFVDCPGHDILMSTMINGVSVMDGAILVVGGNESCPQPQTSEHVAALDAMGMSNILIAQNKVDLINKAKCIENFVEIRQFTKGTVAENAPIIPISAHGGHNVNALLEYIVKFIPEPIRDINTSMFMNIVRTFDINKPGVSIDNFIGGVIGGTISKGTLRVHDTVEIRPGIIIRQDGEIKCKPIVTTITSLRAEQNKIEYALPGGLIGVGTKIDPSLCRGNRLSGQVLGIPGKMPEIYIKIQIHFRLLHKLLGVQSTAKNGTSVSNLEINESIMLTIGSTTIGGTIYRKLKDLVKISLIMPVCADIGDRVAISRKINARWRLIGWGKILEGILAKRI